MDKGKDYRKEEDSQDLLVNSLLDLFLIQTNLLQDDKAFTNFIIF